MECFKMCLFLFFSSFKIPISLMRNVKFDFIKSLTLVRQPTKKLQKKGKTLKNLGT